MTIGDSYNDIKFFSPNSLPITAPSGHVLLKHELIALAKLLASYSDEKLKEIKLNIQKKQGGDISREEVERSLRESGLTSIADDLKEKLEKGSLYYYYAFANKSLAICDGPQENQPYCTRIQSEILAQKVAHGDYC